jgi:hypothetical protein
VEEILDVPGTSTDRAGWMLLGDDTDPTQPGANSDDSERFVYMAFFRDGGGASGDSMDLVARDRNDGWSAFTTVAAGLIIGQWYTISVTCDVAAGTYRVFVDGELEATLTSRHAKTRISHISFAQWEDGAGTFYVDNVMEPGPSVPAVSEVGVIILAFLLATAGTAGSRKARTAGH